MKVFYPPRNLQYPFGRGGLAQDVYYLRAGCGYIASDAVIERMREYEPNDIVVEEYPQRWDGTYRRGDTLTIVCPGGIGDLVVLRGVLGVMREQYPGLNLHLSSAALDTEIMGERVEKCSSFPLPLDAAEAYAHIVAIEDLWRHDDRVELFDAFAERLLVDLPKDMRPYYSLRVSPTEEALAAYRVGNSERPRVGIQVKSAAHYRTYPAHLTALLALELTAEGNRRASDELFEVFLLGGIGDRINWRRDGAPCDPPPHVHDLCGVSHRFAEMVALAAQMDVIVTPDSALLHIGPMLGVPTLALCGVTEGYYRTGYFGRDAMFIQGVADCAPCGRIATQPDCGERFCKAMASISPYYVAEVVGEMFQHGGAPDHAIEYDESRHGPAREVVLT